MPMETASSTLIAREPVVKTTQPVPNKDVQYLQCKTAGHSVIFSYAVPVDATAHISIYIVSGKHVFSLDRKITRNELTTVQLRHELLWNGSYIFSLRSAEYCTSKRVTIVY
jgi:hypothetical protein